MYAKNITFKLIGIGLIAAFALAACSPTATPAPQPTPTASPVPTSVPTATATAVPTVVETAVPTVAPTATTAPTAVPTTASGTPAVVPTLQSSGAAQVVPTLNAYCRKGPGTNYDAITFLLTGNAYNVTGRDGLSSWWQVLAPGNVSCWVGGANVNQQGAVQQVAVVPAPLLPSTPANLENSYVCDTVLKTLGVSLNWAASSDASGYNLYRNGTLLVQLAADASSYHDDAPVAEDLVYALQAFNTYGVSAQVSTSVPACQ